MSLLIISFIAGVLTILAPCILPLLPVIVGRSISDSTLSKRRMFVVVISLGLSVVLFTLVLKASTIFVDIPQDFWKYISGGIIFIFGLVTLFPNLWESLAFTSKINTESNKVLMEGYQKNNVWGDIIVGASLGPIFSACSPTYFVILATVLPAKPIIGFIYLITYALGLSLSLLIVSLLGQKIIGKLNIVSDSHGWFKRTLGVIFIIVALGILTGYDKKLQVSLLDAGFFDVTKIEQKLLEHQDEDVQIEELDSELMEESVDDKSTTENNKNYLTLSEKKKKFILAPDISTPDGFINTSGQPITISEFKGKKVVLLDIWTYSCINCQRTLPYLNDWHKKYEDDGLVIIGLHTPEFAFEHVLKNVQNAADQFNVKYPVVLDNDFSTWVAYKNQYWPRKYLIDMDGYIVYDHAGEGQYNETEKKIQEALSELNYRLGKEVELNKNTSQPVGVISVDSSRVGSPEIYFGSARNSRLANGDRGVDGVQKLSAPININLNNLYLDGVWDFNSEYALNKDQGNIFFKYNAKNVYMVLSSDAGAELEIYIDGALDHTLSVKNETLYSIVEGDGYGVHNLLIKIKSGDLKAFTFTFG